MTHKLRKKPRWLIRKPPISAERFDHGSPLHIVRLMLERMLGATSLDELLSRSVQLIHDLLENDATTVLHYQEEIGLLVTRAIAGEWELPLNTHWPATGGIIGATAQFGRTIVVQDVTTDARFVNYEPWPTLSELCVPIITRHGLWGVLDMQSARRNAYPAIVVAVAETVARQLAIAVENANLINSERNQSLQLQRQTRELKQILALNSQLRIGMDFAQLLQSLADSVASVLGYQVVVVNLVDVDANRVRVVAISQALLTKNHVAQVGATYSWDTFLGEDPERFRISRSYFYPAEVVRPFADEKSENYAQEWRPDDVLLVPIVNHRGEILGVFSVDAPVDQRRPSLATIQGLEIFATQAAVIIENQRLFMQTQNTLTALRNAHERQSQLLAEIRQTQAELVTASKLAAVGTLAAGVAHEFNNLLAAMQGYAELGLIDALENKNEALDIVVRTCQRGTQITRRLLTFARQGEGTRDVVKLDEIAEGAIQLINWDLARYDITIQRDYQAVCLVWGDAGQLMQVVLNLLTNARDAIYAHGGTITIRIEERDDWADLSVIDNGPGIHETVRDRLFEPFVTTKGALGGGDIGGSGLGLSVSYGIVQNHNGQLLVESAPNQGAAFTMRLPRYQDVPSRVQQAQPTPYVAPQHILLADDEPDLRTALAGLLVRFGHTIAQVGNGQDALSRCLTQRWDLLLCDVTMPGLDGPQLIQALRQHGVTIPVVLMTGQVEPHELARVRASEPSAILHKPFTAETLLRAIAQAVLGIS
jgi:signal transduction histidine kinase/putative methionine-R-sulfoxide reductase with GAF domain